MSQQNKDFVRRWFEEVWNKGRESAVDEMQASDGVIHGLQGAMRGPAAFKSFHTVYREAFPDVTIHIDDMVAEGDVVAVRWSGTRAALPSRSFEAEPPRRTKREKEQASCIALCGYSVGSS